MRINLNLLLGLFNILNMNSRAERLGSEMTPSILVEEA
jgi:hypothetical protein